MSRTLENAVRYYIDMKFNSGMTLFKQNPIERLGDLEVILEQIDEYNSKIAGVLREEDLIAEVFPRNVLADMYPNPIGLDYSLDGQHVDVEVSDEMMRELGFVEKVRKKKGFGKRILTRCFKFKGQLHILSKKVTYRQVFEVYEKYGLSHELKSFGIDVDRLYKMTFMSQKMHEYHGGDEFLHEIDHLINYLSAIFCFCLKIEASDFLGDPRSYLESVYAKYASLIASYDRLRGYTRQYVDLLNKYENIGRINFKDSDIAHIRSVQGVWSLTEDTLYDEVDRYQKHGEEDKAEVVSRYIEILDEDKVKIDSLNEIKLLEKAVLQDNCKVKIRDLQNEIRDEIVSVCKVWARKIPYWDQVKGGLNLPNLHDFGGVRVTEFKEADSKILREIKEKYVDVFLDEIDLDPIMQALVSLNMDDKEFERFNIWKFLEDFEFSSELERLKLDVFMEHIAWITFGSHGFKDLEVLVKELYKHYLEVPPSLSECESVEDYVNVWSYEFSEEDDKEEALVRVREMKDGMDMLSLDPEVRSVVLEMLQSKEESGEVLELTDYCLDDSQKVLKMRNINAFMRVLGAEKEEGKGGHTKFTFSVGNVCHSYTVPSSTVKNGKFFALLLLQNISTVNGEPREVDSVFLDTFKLAFKKIGVSLDLKA